MKKLQFASFAVLFIALACFVTASLFTGIIFDVLMWAWNILGMLGMIGILITAHQEYRDMLKH